MTSHHRFPQCDAPDFHSPLHSVDADLVRREACLPIAAAACQLYLERLIERVLADRSPASSTHGEGRQLLSHDWRVLASWRRIAYKEYPLAYPLPSSHPHPAYLPTTLFHIHHPLPYPPATSLPSSSPAYAPLPFPIHDTLPLLPLPSSILPLPCPSPEHGTPPGCPSSWRTYVPEKAALCSWRARRHMEIH